ncbi:MAG: type I-C CRISPR-associated protein Cas8c/Csd1 [Methylococcaceae bacterium]|nr:type I-C CRISPR-associated protein Cas8c/Csd1 [Methylococcaceae bacterium]
MILQALDQYYQRKTTGEDVELSPFGFERKSIPVILEIDSNAELVQIRVTDPKQDPDAAEYIVPQGEKKTSGIAANLIWDNVEYALGIDTRGKPERVAKQHKAFIERIHQLGEPAISDQGIQVLLEYLEKFDPDSLKQGPYWELLKTNPNLSFRLQGDTGLICQRTAVIKSLSSSAVTDSPPALCLITGEPSTPERLHPAIKGVWGAQTSGANIVSFNLDAFNSYGKTQGYNAPVSQNASFAYTTALNHLLRKGSQQRIQVGDASTVFWSERSDPLEQDFQSIWGATPKSIKDDPDKFTEAVKSVLSAVQRGHLSADRARKRFYVLGLAPNAARISIRFWIVGTVAEISHRTSQYFKELDIVHPDQESGFLPLFRLLVNIAVLGKSENIPPNLAGEVMRCILTGNPYPYILLAAAIRRCKAEQSVNYPRAALIKACLNRNQSMEEIKVSLDKDNLSPAYRLGRWFAVLEKIQEEANPGINATIRDRYYGAASANPVSVFATLMKLKNHHLSKLDHPGRKTNFEKLLGEIFSAVPADLPANLSLQDQGRFAVGYYHQRQDFFNKRNHDDQGESA